MFPTWFLIAVVIFLCFWLAMSACELAGLIQDRSRRRGLNAGMNGLLLHMSEYLSASLAQTERRAEAAHPYPPAPPEAGGFSAEPNPRNPGGLSDADLVRVAAILERAPRAGRDPAVAGVIRPGGDTAA